MVISTSLKKNNNILVKEPLEKPTKNDLKEFNERVNKKRTGVNSEFFQKHFKMQRPSNMLKALCTINDRKKNSDLAILIKSGLSNLKNEIENMSEEEKDIEKPNKIVYILEKILEFNDRTQRGMGLKILTPNQMLSRVPITLAQLKVGNNSEKLKNEIRQLLYSLYRSEKITKNFYKSLIDII